MKIEDELTRIRLATRTLVVLAGQNSEDVDAFRQLAGLGTGDGVSRHDDLLEVAIGELDNMVRGLLERMDRREAA